MIWRRSLRIAFAKLIAACNIVFAWNPSGLGLHSRVPTSDLAGSPRSVVMQEPAAPRKGPLAPFKRDERLRQMEKRKRRGEDVYFEVGPRLYARSANYDRNWKWAKMRKKKDEAIQKIKGKYRVKKHESEWKQKKKVPRQQWEYDGNAMYMQVQNNVSAKKKLLNAFEDVSGEEARALAKNILREHAIQTKPVKRKKERSVAAADSRFSWGSCSVGPVLRSRLDELGMPKPLPIQEAAFTPISQGQNVVIGSETGSGKTLAFLVPILSSTSRNDPYSIMILVATPALARQIKGVADCLWPPRTSGKGLWGSVAHVVDDDPSQNKLVNLGNASLVVGTPQALRNLVNQAVEVVRLDAESEEDSESSISGLEQALLLESNLKKVVIDEADELLDTGFLAQQQQLRIRQRQDKGLPTDKRVNFDYETEQVAKRRFMGSDAEMLLLELPRPVTEVQLVCCSATVGRTLRLQLQALLDAPSVEKASTLVSAGRNTKRLHDQLAAWTPSKLEHRYMLMEGDSEDFESALHVSVELRRAMAEVPPRPAIVFVGKPEMVKSLAASLIESGMNNVRHLRHAHDDAAMEREASQWPRHVLNPHVVGDQVAEDSWAMMPIYVGSEEEARGIDLEVDYVFLCSAPSFSASYAHLAGRTARNGRPGLAITLLAPQQAPNLVIFSEQLSISFSALGDDDDDDDYIEADEQEPPELEDAVTGSGAEAEHENRNEKHQGNKQTGTLPMTVTPEANEDVAERSKLEDTDPMIVTQEIMNDAAQKYNLKDDSGEDVSETTGELQAPTVASDTEDDIAHESKLEDEVGDDTAASHDLQEQTAASDTEYDSAHESKLDDEAGDATAASYDLKAQTAASDTEYDTAHESQLEFEAVDDTAESHDLQAPTAASRIDGGDITNCDSSFSESEPGEDASESEDVPPQAIAPETDDEITMGPKLHDEAGEDDAAAEDQRPEQVSPGKEDEDTRKLRLANFKIDFSDFESEFEEDDVTSGTKLDTAASEDVAIAQDLQPPTVAPEIAADAEDTANSEDETGKDEAGTEDLYALTIKVLKDRLRASGLKVSGNKAELIARLETHA